MLKRVVVFVVGPLGCERRRATALSVSHALGCTHYAVGDHLDTLGAVDDQLGRYIAANGTHEKMDPIASECVARHVADETHRGRSVVIEGFPRTQAQARDIGTFCTRLRVVVLGRICDNLDALADAMDRTGCVHRTTDDQSATLALVLAAPPPPPLPIEPAELQPATAIEHALVSMDTAATLREPIALGSAHLERVASGAYMSSHVTDGRRALAVVRYGRCWLLDPGGPTHKTPWSAQLMSWDGTVLDVELLEGQCVVLDALAVCGRRVGTRHLLSRLNAATSLGIATLGEVFTNGAVVRQYYAHSDLRCAMHIGSPQGMAFTSTTLPYRAGARDGFYHWRPSPERTLSLMYRGGRLRSTDGTDYGTLVERPTWLEDGGCAVLRAQHMSPERPDENRWLAVRSCQTGATLVAAQYTCRAMIDGVTPAQMCAGPGIR